MSMIIDQKYANLLSEKLKLFSWIGTNKNTANFRCPVCGDSQKSKTKKRGYLIPSKHGLHYKCHNCQISVSFSEFLKMQNDELWKEYKIDKFKHSADHRWQVKKQTKTENDVRKEYTKTVIERPRELKVLKNIEELDVGDPCKAYVIKRKIPEKYWKDLYYTDNYTKWVNDYVISDKFSSIQEKDERLIIPFRDKNGNIFAYQGRTLTNNTGAKYITVTTKEDHSLIYGLNTVDYTYPFYVFEGPIDSMYIPNSVAGSGTNLKKFIKMHGTNSILVFDNQPRSPEIVNIVKNTIKSSPDENIKIVIWPESLQEKDVGEMIENGMPIKDVVKLLKRYTITGKQKAYLEFLKWKKI